MAKKISFWIKSHWYFGIVAILMLLLFYSTKKMFFHQDDLDWFILANKSFIDMMLAPIGDHVNYLWRVLLKIEWELFGLQFPPYAMVSVLMHGIVVWLLYLLAYETSGRKDLAMAVAYIFVINTNWTETVLWISGQTISITAIFVLLTMLSIWRKKHILLMLLLSSWTSALALGLHAASLLVYKKLRLRVASIILLIGMIYKLGGGDGTSISFGIAWAVKAILVWGLMIVNSLIGRSIIPFDKFEIWRIVLVLIAITFLLQKSWRKIPQLWNDKWTRFLVVQFVIYYLVVAVGRSQFGIGIMRAERYVYLGMALGLLIIARWMRNTKIRHLSKIVAMIVVIQIAGFWHRSSYYVDRPQQMKELFEKVRGLDGEKCYRDEYLPQFVLQDERLRYSDLLGIWQERNLITSEKEECAQIEL